MKVLWKVAVLLLVLLAIISVMDNKVMENEPLESPVKQGTAIPMQDSETTGPLDTMARPTQGLSTYVGKSADILIEAMGKPERIEPSEYGYDWWVYKSKLYFMAGVENGIITQIYSADEQADMSPFQISEGVDSIYRSMIVEPEVNVQVDENLYTFSLNSEDIKNRLLIAYDGLYAQVYIDSEDQEIEGVRFIDPVTLVIHQPYDMSYLGEMVNAKQPSSTIRVEVDRAMERQIFDLTNQFRKKHGLQELISEYWLRVLARKHSEEMALENYFSQDSPASGSLSNRLKEAKIEHRKAGENIAFNYVDAIEAVHGWLNSSAHRNMLLEKDFTHIGTGTYGKYYTQDFIQRDVEETDDR